MKRILLFVFALVMIVGCRSYNVYVEKDDIAKKEIYKVDMYHQVVKGDVSIDYAKYEREKKNGKLSPVKMTIQLVGTQNAKGMKRNVTLLVDDKTFNATMASDPKASKFKRDWIDGSVSQSGSITATKHEINWNLYTAQLVLSADVMKALSTAGKFKMRFYLSNEEWTVEATSKEIEGLKKLIAVTEK